jgi:multisubunit Na+/H+ antiporter MnhG subunit
MNSTYLESVDKWFGWKGTITALVLAFLAIFGALYVGLVHLSLTRAPDFQGETGDGTILTIVGLIVLPFLAGFIWLLFKDSFAYTHYPMRFNRKTRMVHVFRTNGTVLSVPWDAIFFTLGHMPQWEDWEVRGHVLDPDGVTVRETFALSYVGELANGDVDPLQAKFSDQDFVRAHWEFVRRYMEEGPQAVTTQVQFCMPISAQRESFKNGVERVFANIAAAPFLLYWLLFPLCLAVSLARVIAMRTSKIPQWPAEVETTSTIEPGDPYAIEGDQAGERVASYPAAAAAAGIAFIAKASPGAGKKSARKLVR